MVLGSGETIQLLDEKKMTRQDLYLKIVELDPLNSYAYINLGTTLEHETIQMLDGKMMTKPAFYLKAIELDPSNAYAYKNLAMTVQSGETIQPPDGRLMTQQELFELG